VERIDLSGEWRLQKNSGGESIPALLPGDTMSALLRAGAIPDPYVGRQELAAQWIGREDWLFTRTIVLTDEAARSRMLYLNLDSVDTCAEVHLNGKPVGRSRNMFVRRRFDLTAAAKSGENTLSILIRSPEREAQAESRTYPYPLPHSEFPIQSPHRNLIRKVQCHAGWDWGPCLMVSGLYGELSIGASASHRIEYVRTRQLHKSERRWEIAVTVELFSVADQETTVSAILGGVSARKQVTLVPGLQTTTLSLVLDNPELWWPAGYGDQPLYDLVVSTDEDEVRKHLGVRSIEVVSVEDEGGRSLTFRVNGREIFAKGANWIPTDALPARQTRERYESLLQSAIDANMNMIRVWGGGQYEADAFYELCDEKGLLVWHDFMFACGTYPATKKFLETVRAEVVHQVKRLVDHACIALWCGNNENLGALWWFEETRKNRDRYLVDYDRLYEGTIGAIVEELDPDRTFWPSSPSAGRNDYSDNWHSDSKGDMHYWSVWHEGKSFDGYYEVTPRFCSEFGFQSFPSPSTVASYALPDERNLTSPVMEHHQRNRRGNSIIIESFSRYFRFPEGFANTLFLSQAQQALAIKTAVEYWRSRRPVCMGALYWQLNDNWPVASWSSIEYGGKWKLLHYAARRFFQPIHIMAFVREGHLEVWGSNDTAVARKGRFSLSLLTFTGAVKESRTQEVVLRAEAATAIATIDIASLPLPPEELFAWIGFESDGLVVENDAFLALPKSSELADPEIQLHVRAPRAAATHGPRKEHATSAEPAAAEAALFEVELIAKHPAFYVSLDAGELAGRFDDNWLTLLPGRPRVLRFYPVQGGTGSAGGNAAVETGAAGQQQLGLEQIRDTIALYHLRATYR